MRFSLPPFTLLTMVLVFAAPCISGTGKPSPGPIVAHFGPVYDVAQPTHAAPRRAGVRAVFDVGSAAADSIQVNPSIETVARYLNMHARAGFPKNKVHAALVLHGAASEAALNAQAYRERHGIPNPDLQLLSELRAAGVQIFLCGQSAAHRGIARDDLSADVDLALSAMTVLVQLQSSGYSLIAF